MKNKKVKSKHLGGNWYSGECGDYTFQAKAFVEPSDYGIDCGKVSKLHIQKDDEWRVNYDRGWKAHSSRSAEMALSLLHCDGSLRPRSCPHFRINPRV